MHFVKALELYKTVKKNKMAETVDLTAETDDDDDVQEDDGQNHKERMTLNISNEKKKYRGKYRIKLKIQTSSEEAIP